MDKKIEKVKVNVGKINIDQEKEVEENKDDVKDEGVLDMVIAFDTTGSMSSYIENVKKHVKELVPELFKTNPNLQLSIVAFGDYCDMENAHTFGKAYQCIGLTRNENDVIDFISKAKNTSGGDGDEFYELVLKKIIEETEWRKESKKSILLIADAAPHPLGYTYQDYVVNNQIDWMDEAKKASEKSIQIDTLSLFYGKEDDNWYKKISAMTNGVYAPFNKSENTDELIRVSAYSRSGDYGKAAYISTCAAYCDSVSSDGLLSINSEKGFAGDDGMTATLNAFMCKTSITSDELNSAITSK